jgi:hypothetical protein
VGIIVVEYVGDSVGAGDGEGTGGREKKKKIKGKKGIGQ